LPEANNDAMNFSSGGSADTKAWRDIWGAGQGVGSVHDIPTVDELVMRMEREYQDAHQRLGNA
jgi:nitronate monooxygenase